MAGNREFDRERFKDLVLFIAHKTQDDPRFGRTKLAKALFYLDFAAYAGDGASVTGATYHHWPRGPFPPILYEVERELERQGLVRIQTPQHEGDEAKLYPRGVLPPLRLEDYHKHLAAIEVDRVSADPTWKVTDDSHEHPGWIVSRDREPIPYYAVHIAAKGPTPHDVERAEAIARDHSW